MDRDWGIYDVLVETDQGKFVHQFDTKWIHCRHEQDIMDNIVWMFTEGSFACDCNMGDFLALANGRVDPNLPCGDTIKLLRLTAFRPDKLTHCIIWEEEND